MEHSYSCISRLSRRRPAQNLIPSCPFLCVFFSSLFFPHPKHPSTLLRIPTTQHLLVVAVSLAYHRLQSIQPTHIHSRSLPKFRSFSNIYPFFLCGLLSSFVELLLTTFPPLPIHLPSFQPHTLFNCPSSSTWTTYRPLS